MSGETPDGWDPTQRRLLDSLLRAQGQEPLSPAAPTPTPDVTADATATPRASVAQIGQAREFADAIAPPTQPATPPVTVNVVSPQEAPQPIQPPPAPQIQGNQAGASQPISEQAGGPQSTQAAMPPDPATPGWDPSGRGLIGAASAAGPAGPSAPTPVAPQTPTQPLTVQGRADQIADEATRVPQYIDPSTGQPKAPTEDEVAYRQSQLLDKSFQDGVRSNSLAQATEEERARQGLSVQRELQARTDEYVAMHRKFWDDARTAQAQANDRYPNPDDLLGGRGSWSRAIAIGIATSGLPNAAALVNSQLELQMGGRAAEYNRLRQGASDALANSDEAMTQLAAAQGRAAESFRTIAAGTADPAIKAKYLGISSELDAKAAENLGKFATQQTNSALKDQHMAQAGWKFYKGRWYPPPGQGGASGGTGGGGSGPGLTTSSPGVQGDNPFTDSSGGSIPRLSEGQHDTVTPVNSPIDGTPLLGLHSSWADLKPEQREKKAEGVNKALQAKTELNRHLGIYSDLMRQVNSTLSVGGSLSPRLKSDLEHEIGYLRDVVIVPEQSKAVFGGFKPSIGEMKRAGEELPEPKGIVESLANGNYDPLKFIDFLETDLEHATSEELNSAGVNYNPVIRKMTGRYVSSNDIVAPTPEQRQAAASEANVRISLNPHASNEERLNAASAYDAATKAVGQSKAGREEGDFYVKNLDKFPQHIAVSTAPDSAPSSLKAEYEGMATLDRKQEATLSEARQLQGDRSWEEKARAQGQGVFDRKKSERLDRIRGLGVRAFQELAARQDGINRVEGSIIRNWNSIDPSVTAEMTRILGPSARPAVDKGVLYVDPSTVPDRYLKGMSRNVIKSGGFIVAPPGYIKDVYERASLSATQDRRPRDEESGPVVSPFGRQ